MDAKERARLRALCEAATPGPWTCRGGSRGCVVLSVDESMPPDGVGERSVAILSQMVVIRPEARRPTGDFVAASRTAIPALLDALDAAERERDEARAEVERLRAGARLQHEVSTQVEREACAEVAEAWLRDAREITQDSPEELADAIRTRGGAR